MTGSPDFTGISRGKPFSLNSARAFVRSGASRHLRRLPLGRLGVPFGGRGDVLAACAFAAMTEDRARAREFEGRRDAELDSLSLRLEECVSHPDHPVFVVLGDTIRRRRIPVQIFRDIISAARQDAVKRRYENLEELVEYCRISSCPIGRLILHLADNWDARVFGLMDALCTGIRLCRIWQEIPVDHADGRSYIPRREASGFGVDVDSAVTGRGTGDTGGLIRQLVGWTRGYFEIARPLAGLLRRPMRYGCSAAWHEGMVVLEKTERLAGEALYYGPALTLADRARVLRRVFSGGL